MLHAFQHRGGVEFSTSAKHEPDGLDRADERDLQVIACGRINLGEDAWIEKEGGAQIEAKSGGRMERPPTRLTFEELHLQAGLR